MMCPQCAELRDRVEELELALGLADDANPARSQRLAALQSAFKTRPTPTKILLRLYAANGRAVERWSLVDECTVTDPSDKLIHSHVNHLRKRLGHDAIETVWGHGYRLAPGAVARVAAVLPVFTSGQPSTSTAVSPAVPKVAA